MLIKQFDEEQLKEAAQAIFPNQYIQVMESDIFLRDCVAGRYEAPWLDHEFFISTDYAYEDKIINGNKTRYKVTMCCVLIKPTQYDILYDTKDVYFVAYEEAGAIKFIKYLEILPLLVQELNLLEEIRPV